MDSAKKSKKIREAKEITRSRGGYMGSPRPFGYQNHSKDHAEIPKGALIVIPDEAKAIRRGADLILAGHGLRYVAQVWNAAGVTRPSGSVWDHSTVSRVLRNERIAGLYDGRGASWEAIVSAEVFRDVCAALTARDSGGSATRSRRDVGRGSTCAADRPRARFVNVRTRRGVASTAGPRRRRQCRTRGTVPARLSTVMAIVAKARTQRPG